MQISSKIEVFNLYASLTWALSKCTPNSPEYLSVDPKQYTNQLSSDQ